MRAAAILGTLLLLAAPADTRAQQLPYLARVSGVGAGDVLNIRAAPSARAPIVGSLPPDMPGVEVIGRNGDGTWVMLNSGERAGWAAARYLAADAAGASPLERVTRCFGTEPDWTLDIAPGGATAVLFRIGGPREDLRAGPVSPGRNRTDRALLPLGRYNAVLSAAHCGDGMSDRVFAIEVNLMSGDEVWTGCCTIAP